MKVAFWGVALFVLAVFGLLLISLFGNITVTNQLNYTSMKVAVESAMYDSINMGYYRSGFCFCPASGIVENENHQKVYSNQNQYTIEEMSNDTCDTARNCEPRYGEYVIDAKIFSESMVRRFSELVNNNKDYKLIIQDVVEYPPKVSIKIDSDDTFIMNEGSFTIANQMDAILEEKGSVLVIEPSVTSPSKTIETSTPQPTATSNGYQSNFSNCKWHAVMNSVNVIDNTGTLRTVSCSKRSLTCCGSQNEAINKNKSTFETYAKNSCLNGLTFSSISINGYQYYNVYYYGTTNIACSNVEATSPSHAKSNCSKCIGKKCVAICH